MSARAGRYVRIHRHGIDLVRADVRPAARQGRGRRRGPLSIGRRPDRPRDHRRHRHVQPSRRRSGRARQAQGQAYRATARRSSRPASMRRSCSTARASTRSRRSSSPASGPTATTPRVRSTARASSFVVEVDGVHTIHLGEIGHLLTEEKLGDIGPVDIACVPLGGALSPTKAAALIAQLDPKIVVPMPLCEDEADCAEALAEVLPRDGRGARDAAEAVGDRVEPARRDDDGAPRVARRSRPRGGRGRRGRA